MVKKIYECERCLHQFKQKSHYDRHKENKNICPNIVESETFKKLLKEEKIKKENDKIIKYIDLFSGMGSFHYSFKKLGFKCIMACDNNKSAKENYKLNYNLECMDDICNINPKDIDNYDILCAGFPCQPWSNSGNKKGFKDERGSMFSHIMKFVKINIPKIIILENVQGLLKHNKGKSFESMKKNLEDEGYKVIYNILKCSDYGIPQMRKRLFIICFKNIEVNNIDNFLNFDEYIKNNTLASYLNKNFEKEIAYTIRCGGRKSPINDKHNWDGYIVDNKEYRLTIDDALKLQGFKNYKLIGNDTQKWKLLGNTIPTIFTDLIGKQILKYCIFNKNNGENNDENNLKLKEENLKLKEENLKLKEENLKLKQENLNLTQDTKLIETCNKGEYHEVKAIKKLFKLNYNKEFKKLISIFGDEASNGINIINLNTNKNYNNITDIEKAKSIYKADVGIQMIKTKNIYYCSIKSASCSNPAILNHTHRNAYVFQKGELYKELSNLDILIDEYINKRNKCEINEDCNLNKLESLLNDNIKKSLINTLKYFIFNGTGKGLSKISANSILIYNNENDINFELYDNDDKKYEYAKNLLNKCIISLRNKGMPKKITDNHEPWIYKDNNKKKGSIHIRIKN